MAESGKRTRSHAYIAITGLGVFLFCGLAMFYFYDLIGAAPGFPYKTESQQIGALVITSLIGSTCFVMGVSLWIERSRKRVNHFPNGVWNTDFPHTLRCRWLALATDLHHALYLFF